MKRTNKGFTLAELLIVVAIIAILVAVAIPTLNSQLERSRQSTDLANLRDAYAVAKLAIMNGETPAVSADGVSTLPIKIGFPEEIKNMPDSTRDQFSGIGYAFVFDADSGLLLPYDATGYKDTFSSDGTYTQAAATTAKQSCWVANGKIPTQYKAAKTVVVDSTKTVANQIITPFTTTDLKAHSNTMVIDDSTLPGENLGTVEYGAYVEWTQKTVVAATDKTLQPISNLTTTSNVYGHRLWGNTDADYEYVRIVVEFSYDPITQSWTLARVAGKDPTAEIGDAANQESSKDVTVGAIRFQNLYANSTTSGSTTTSLGFRAAFQPHSEKTNRNNTFGSSLS